MQIQTRNCSVLLSLLLSMIMLSVSISSPDPAAEASVYIVFTAIPENTEPKAFHMRTLIAVLGSEDAAKRALVYSYNNVVSGFAAQLTSVQVKELSKQPGVLLVIPSRLLHLDIEPAKPNF